MTRAQRALLFLVYFNLGICSPILSLLLLSKGASLQTLPLALGAYSATVTLFEVPSGILADLIGRKRVFLLSCAFNIATSVLLWGAGHYRLLLLAMILNGLGRAFASGTLEAVFIEDAVRRGGAQSLRAVTGQLSLCQNIALMLGALVGGALPARNGYGAQMLLRLVCVCAATVLCAVSVRETRPAPDARRATLRSHLQDCAAALRKEHKITGLLVCSAALGVFLFFIETYWQSAFLALAGEKSRPLLGAVSTLGFGMQSAGNLLIRRMPVRSEWRWYFGLRVLIALGTLLFAPQLGVAGFLVAYGLTYLLLGGMEVLEQALLNRMVPNAQRASLLSISSLSLQAGCLSASLIAAAAVGILGFTGLFGLGGGAVLLGTSVPALQSRAQRKGAAAPRQ